MFMTCQPVLLPDIASCFLPLPFLLPPPPALLLLLLLLPLLNFGTARSSDISCWQKTEGGKINFLFFGPSLLLLLPLLLLLSVGEELTLEGGAKGNLSTCERGKGANGSWSPSTPQLQSGLN